MLDGTLHENDISKTVITHKGILIGSGGRTWITAEFNDKKLRNLLPYRHLGKSLLNLCLMSCGIFVLRNRRI